MDYDPNVDLEELEREWDIAQDAAEIALDEWFQDDDESSGESLIDKVLQTQREQRDRYRAVRSLRKSAG